jgi:hypothetical protein
VGGRGKGESHSDSGPRLFVILFVVWAAAKTEGPTVAGQTKDQRGQWSVPFR